MRQLVSSSRPWTSELKSFQPPEGKEVISADGQAQQIDISAVVGFQSHLFTFRENANTPGRTLEQTVGVTIPAGAGWFVVPSFFTGAFTNGDFSRLTERPLGQFFVQLFVRNNNTLVCRVRLTDSNSDDPIFIQVQAGLVTIT
jgi:hypothetical protein